MKNSTTQSNSILANINVLLYLHTHTVTQHKMLLEHKTSTNRYGTQIKSLAQHESTKV